MVCYDGEKTEADYFVGWRRELGSSALDLRPYFVASGGNVLEAVEQTVAKKRADSDYDEYWCVCDVDDTSTQRVNQAKALAMREGVSLCLSNRCFEVWIALHWGKISTSAIESERQARALVAKHHADYARGAKVIPFHLLLPRTAVAVESAAWLQRQALGNPITEVHELVSKLDHFRGARS